jgi:hypothetical protein
VMRHRVAGGGDELQVWRVAANISDKKSQTDTGSGSPAWELGEGLTTLRRKGPAC